MKSLKIIPIAALLAAVFSISLSYQARASVASDLSRNYNNVVTNCGSANKPAFLCSGNLIRFTGYSTAFHSWNPSANSIRTGAVSFMYMRRDIPILFNFGNTVSGIIYYPVMNKPAGKRMVPVKCAFPSDSWTSARPDGCKRPDTSQQCQDMGISTAVGWLMNYNILSGNKAQYQCAFNMGIGVPNTAAAFNENINVIKNFYNLSYNEIILQTPATSNGEVISPETLPIQAFFYLEGRNEAVGMQEALLMEYDYLTHTGVTVPVVRISHPAPLVTNFVQVKL